jgi:hypothetical protein
VRALARIVVSAALLGSGFPIAISGPTASAAPTADSPPPPAEFHLFASDETPRSAFWSDAPFVSEQGVANPPVVSVVFSSDARQASGADPVAQSPAIALPPAVSSGLGLLCVLAACMMLRRFAYRPASLSRRHS